MEVMVVIVVIAVLASVAGPMIGSIVDQGRESATKEKLSALKSGIMAYYADTGRFPHCDKAKDKTNGGKYYQGDVLGLITSKNVLVYRDVTDTHGNTKDFGRKYKTKWKGPYMETDPEDFMFDAWGKVIRYVAVRGHNKLYLWSAGADGFFYGDKGAVEGDGQKVTEAMGTKGLEAVLSGEPNGAEDEDVPLDDIIVSIGLKYRLKESLPSNTFHNYRGTYEGYKEWYEGSDWNK